MPGPLSPTQPQDFTIIVEGSTHDWPTRSISYAELVTLFDPTFPQHPEITYSVTYERGPSENPEGVLSPDGKVIIQNRMIFHVSKTGQS